MYIFFINFFLVTDKHYLTINADNYNVLTRQRHNLHLSQENLAIFFKRAFYARIEIFNGLPTEIKVRSDNTKVFETALKHFFIHNLFYTQDEYFN